MQSLSFLHYSLLLLNDLKVSFNIPSVLYISICMTYTVISGTQNLVYQVPCVLFEHVHVLMIVVSLYILIPQDGIITDVFVK